MRKQLLLLAGALLCPALAGAHSPYSTNDPLANFWLGVGFGGGSITSAAPAPSADRDAFTFSIDGGYRITGEWGLGLEYDLVAPKGGCTGHRCTPAMPDFAPEFSHWGLVGEYRPNDSGVRLRAGAGVSSMCYRYYKSSGFSWAKVLVTAAAVIFRDDGYDGGGSFWTCKNLQALGTSVSIGYQWALPDSDASVGLQLRGEATNFAASSKANTPAFHHRAVLGQLQLDFN